MSSRAVAVLSVVALPVVGLAALGTLSCGGTPEVRGVVVIGVDALRADHLGLYGYSRATSPALDRLAGEAVVFDHAYSTSSWTLPAFASMLTGEHPLGHGAGVREMPEVEPDREAVSVVPIGPGRFSGVHADVPTVPERFSAAGFATAAVVQNPYMSPPLGLDRGFETYDHAPSNNVEIRRADEVVARALDWIDGLGPERERFFLFVHLFDPHLDYDPPEGVRGTFTADPRFREFELPVSGLWPIRNAESLPGGFVDFMTAAYDEEIRFVDAQVGRFVEALRERGLWDELLVILTSDHGEEFFEHDGFEHGHSLYQEVVRVPFLVWAPGVEPGRRRVPVSVADVGPTALEAVGLEPTATQSAATPPAGDRPGAFGRSLWPALLAGEEPPNRLLVVHGTLYGRPLEGAVLWPYKLIRGADDPAAVLYDLSEDPGELHDLAAELPGVRDSLAAGLDRALNETALDVLSQEVELSEATLERLRALGYIR